MTVNVRKGWKKGGRICAAIGLIIHTLSTTSGAQSSPWNPPIGIPAPPFGINEAAPAAPNPWTSPRAGFYYVDESNPASTDTNNPYGTPALPRHTIPLSLPAGSVVEVRGVYTKNHRSPATLTLNGTATAPVFIRGASPTARTRATQAWQITGQYFIVENMEFSQLTQQLLLVSPILRGVLRHSSVTGTATTGGIAVGGGSGYPATDVVIFKNSIHDNGDVNATFDQDRHGIVVSSYVQNLWILENELYRNSGDGVQINAGSQALQATTNHIYVGRNVSHHNKQTGMWTKQAMDVIFSENLIYGHRPGNSSYGAGMGQQYAPERVWYLYNHIHDCETGIGFSSDSGLGSGQYAFIIGNVIHNIHASTPFNTSAWGQSAIMMAGGVNRYILNNTIYDVESGIQSPARGTFSILNNIIARVTNALGSHVNFENSDAATAATIHNNLFEGTVRIKWGSATVYGFSSFQSTFGKGQASVNADPLFVNAAQESFGLQAASPAVDRGTAEVEQLFSGYQTLYGVSIFSDLAGEQRPQGAGWDIGSYEGSGTARPSPPTNLRIIR